MRSRFTYIILAHERPDAVLRLAGAILSEVPASRVLVHYSSLSGDFPDTRDERIRVVESPVAVRWGTFSQVEMMLRCLHEIRRQGLPDDWVVTLSGHCYPIRPLAELEQMLPSCAGDAYFWSRRIETCDRDLLERYTFDYRVVRHGPLPFPLSLRAVRGVINHAQPFIRLKSVSRIAFVGLRRRRSIPNLVPHVYFGTQWIALSRRAVGAIHEALARSPEVLEAYRGTMAPEESFFSTVLAADPSLRVVKADLHYVDWSTARTGSPRALSLTDLPAIERSEKWFARKIDLVRDDGLRDALDALRGLGRPPAAARPFSYR